MPELQPEQSPRLLADRYLLVQRLGEGSAGVVYRSFDRELEEWVAVKLLRAERTAVATACADLRRTVKLARRVTHPNVTRVHEFGRDGHEVFLTMEYIAAESLQTCLTRIGRLPPAEIPGLAIDLCRGLAAAHAVGVVHGDLTPDNILLAPVRGAVLTDFGIARSLGELPRQPSRYTAPELLTGAEASPRADLYALGVMLFEALTGLSSWAGVDPQRRARAVDPDLRALAPTLAGGWLELLGACLRRHPDARPPDAQTVLSELLGLYRGTGHVGVATVDDDEPPALPVGVGPRWVAVLPFAAVDPALQRHTTWLTADLVQALGHVPSLRVVTNGQGPGGPLPQIRGELRPAGEGLQVAVDIDGAAAFVLDHPRELLPNLGVELAARILAALDGSALPQKVTHPELLHPDVVDHYIQARTAVLALRSDDAVQHFEAALALAPRHRGLRVGYAQARVRYGLLFRSPSAEEFAELRALVEATVGEHRGSAEACIFMSALLMAVNEPIECVRWACAAAARAPIAGAFSLIGSVLLAIGRLPDAARRFDIAAALEQHSVQLWLCRAELAAHEGRWDDFYALVHGPLAGMRIVYIVHLMLWRPDRATLELLAAELADDTVQQRPEMRRDLRALVDFMLERGDRRRLLDELVAIYRAGPRCFHSRRMHMILCEMACILGDRDGALELLGRADEQALIEWQWLSHSPNLAAIRGEPRFLELRARVRERADAVAEVIWG